MFGTIFPVNAPLSADFTMTLELTMGTALLYGASLARQGRYRLHAGCQSLVVLLNLMVIAVAMAPSLYERVLPKIPARMGRSFYALATAHAASGIIAEAGALYVLLAEGTAWLPERWRLRNFKAAMRTVLALWWIALLLGFATYMRWYVDWSQYVN